MSLEAKRISILKTEMEAGIHPLLISDVKLHKRNGDIVLNEGNPGVILTFKNPEDKLHQELYWIDGYNYTKLQKILINLDLDPAIQHDKKEIISKHVWGVIHETIIVRGVEPIRSEKRLIETFKFGEKPKYNKPTTEYQQEQFNQENPAF